jgi:HEAT repeat protein
VEIYALQSIGEIDPDGNKGVLLRALKSQEFPVRRAAAEALSKTNDASVLTELEVVASQEKSRGQSGVIQVLADAMRARMSAVVK